MQAKKQKRTVTKRKKAAVSKGANKAATKKNVVARKAASKKVLGRKLSVSKKMAARSAPLELTSIEKKVTKRIAAERLPHTDFTAVFSNKATFLNDGEEHSIEASEWSSLCTPSGQLIASDALAPCWGKRFSRKVKPGTYPVLLARDEKKGASVALMVRFSRRRVVEWEVPKVVGESPGPFPDNQHVCFGVDSGMAGVFDAAAAPATYDEEWSNRFVKEYSASKSLELDPKTGAGMTWCFPGLGDGAYPCYWGLDSNGEPVCLVLDFWILVEPIHETHEIVDLAKKVGRTIRDPWLTKMGCRKVSLNAKPRKKNEFILEYKRRHRADFELRDGDGNSVSNGHGSRESKPGTRVYDIHMCHIQMDCEKPDARLVLKSFIGVRSWPKK